MTTPRRGDVWEDPNGENVLVVSADFWNRRRVTEVVVVGVAELSDVDEPVDEPYVAVIRALDRRWQIYADDLFAAPKADLVRKVFTLGPQAVRHLGAVLRAELSDSPARADPGRPPRHPRPGQIRFADLRIGDGVESKPVVVVSSEEYAQRLEYELVIVCRVSSMHAVHDLDVRIGDGKVVCSDVRTVRASDITERTPKLSAVGRAEQDEIRRKLHRFLGLD